MTSTVLTVRKTLMGAIWRLLSLQSGSALRNTVVGAIAVMAIGLFGRVLSYPVPDDENINIATALLLSDHHIHRDLGFVHLPNLPLMLTHASTGRAPGRERVG